MKKKSLNAKKIILKKLLKKLKNPKIKNIYNIFNNNLSNFKNVSKIAIASSDSRFFKILTIDSEERYFIISDCIDSLSSTNTSGSILKLLSLINFSLSF